jgi:hypothetical protein
MWMTSPQRDLALPALKAITYYNGDSCPLVVYGLKHKYAFCSPSRRSSRLRG